MMRDRGWVCLACAACVLLAACGGGEATSVTGPGGVLGIATGDPDRNQVVVRYDHDGDGFLDTVTVDTSRDPLSIVEAVRGTPDGGGIDATRTWAGDPLEPALNEALQVHLSRTFSAACPTYLDLELRGTAVTVTVIE